MANTTADEEVPEAGAHVLNGITADLDLEELRGLLAHASDMVIVTDMTGITTYVSPPLERICGFAPAEVIGQPASVAVHPGDRDRVVRELSEQIRGLRRWRPVEFRQLCRDGSFRHVEATVSRLPDDHPLGAVVVNLRDVTERLDAEEAQREHHAVMRMVAEGRPLPEVLGAIVELTERRAPGCVASVLRVETGGGNLRVASGAHLPDELATALDGAPIGADGGSSASAAWLRAPVYVTDVASDPRAVAIREVAAEEGIAASWSVPLISKSADVVLGTVDLHWRESRSPGPDEAALILEAAGLATIALERYRIEGELAHRATHDDLTGLPNRALLTDRMLQALARRRRHDLGHVVTMFLDLDGFKAVNDRYGHQVGDALLVEAAHRLTATVREVDTVARFGGDEFIVLAHTDDVEVLSNRVQSSIVDPLESAGDLLISWSVGVAVAGDDDTPATLLRRADRALYEAKRGGRDQFVIDAGIDDDEPSDGDDT